MNQALTLDYWFADEAKAEVDPEVNLLEAEAEALVGDAGLIEQVKVLQDLQEH